MPKNYFARNKRNTLQIYWAGNTKENGKAAFFYCPGCQCHHFYQIENPVQDQNWTFDGNWSAPSFSPSLLVNKDDPNSRCHLFVRAGRIEYCSDSHHALKGATVDMVPMEGEYAWSSMPDAFEVMDE